MPKETAKEQKLTWHQEFQEGASVAQLAKKHGKDPRTIRRAIDQVERDVVTKQARTDLLKEGLSHHQQVMLELLREVAAVPVPLPLEVDLDFPAVRPPAQLTMPGWTAYYQVDKARYHDLRLVVEEAVDQEFTWRLVLEHLRRDAALRALSAWKQAVLEELNQRLRLRDYVAEYVAKVLNLRVSDDIREPGTVRPSALWDVYVAVLSLMLGERVEYSFAVTQGEDGEFFVNGASGGRLSTDGQTFKQFSGQPESIASAEPAVPLRDLHKEARKRALQAREGLLEIVASYYLPGTCRSCKRFGA